MKDRDFLIWLHERLTEVCGESAIVDYMHKLRAIIRDMPSDKESPNTCTGNSLRDILEKIGAPK
jgi:hypothetical protein